MGTHPLSFWRFETARVNLVKPN